VPSMVSVPVWENENAPTNEASWLPANWDVFGLCWGTVYWVWPDAIKMRWYAVPFPKPYCSMVCPLASCREKYAPVARSTAVEDSTPNDWLPCVWFDVETSVNEPASRTTDSWACATVWASSGESYTGSPPAAVVSGAVVAPPFPPALQPANTRRAATATAAICFRMPPDSAGERKTPPQTAGPRVFRRERRTPA
jgi:hypothetical protein